MNNRNSKSRTQKARSLTGYRTPENTDYSSVVPLNRKLQFSMNDVTSIINAVKDIANGKNPSIRTAELALKYGPTVGNAIIRGYDRLFGKKVSKAITVAPELTPKEIKKEVEVEKKLSGIMTAAPPHKNLTRPPTQFRVKRDGSSKTMEGCDVLASLAAPAGGYAAGDVIYTARINPTTLSSRLKKASSFYEQYLLGGEFILQSGSGTNVPGGLCAYIDYDPSDPLPTNSPNNVNLATAHQGAQLAAIWEGFKLPIKKSNEPQRLYLDNDGNQERFTDVGIFSIICTQPIAALAPIGILSLKWHMDLMIPQVEFDQPSGNHWYAELTASSTAPMSTSSAFGTMSVRSTSDIDISVLDAKTGSLLLPAGSFCVSTIITSGTSLDGTSLRFEQASGSKYPPAWNPALGTEHVDSNDMSSFALEWVTCPSPFVAKFCLSIAGTWLAERIHICATNASPYAATFRMTRHLMERAYSAQLQQKSVADLLEDARRVKSVDTPVRTELSESKEAVSREKPRLISPELYQDDYVQVTSGTSSRTSSSSYPVTATRRQ